MYRFVKYSIIPKHCVHSVLNKQNQRNGTKRIRIFSRGFLQRYYKYLIVSVSYFLVSNFMVWYFVCKIIIQYYFPKYFILNYLLSAYPKTPESLVKQTLQNNKVVYAT